ncbi:hypothetical protein [Streptomyces sp. NPDC006510]|uniref:hypothetical protein n=1 Tax=Streptomyces sp. NPDC006510 TaxID=3155600 RepID=UPI0033BDE9B7
MAGPAAQLLGTGAALLCLNSLYVGPVASALDGADVSVLLGPLVGAPACTVLFSSLCSRQLDQVSRDRADESTRSTAATA